VRGAFLGDLLALTGALMAAGYLIIGAACGRGYPCSAISFVVYGMAAIVLW